MAQHDEIPARVVLVARDGTEVVLGCVGDRPADLALVEVLARLQLRARRRGERVRLDGAPRTLRALLVLVGLDDVLGLEPRREAEGGEVLGADEVVQADDLLP